MCGLMNFIAQFCFQGKLFCFFYFSFNVIHLCYMVDRVCVLCKVYLFCLSELGQPPFFCDWLTDFRALGRRILFYKKPDSAYQCFPRLVSFEVLNSNCFMNFLI